MYIGARAARELLTRPGVSSWSAERVLASGIAGEPIRTGHAVLYEEARVNELAARPSSQWPEVDQRCPAGIFVSRRDFPATGSRTDQMAALSGGWSGVCPWVWVAMAVRIQRNGYLPFVATVGGLVVVGADIVEARGLSELVLAPPGPWFEVLDQHWFPTGRGRPWVLYLGPLIAAGEVSPDAA
jgi:hypothetical protein